MKMIIDNFIVRCLYVVQLRRKTQTTGNRPLKAYPNIKHTGSQYTLRVILVHGMFQPQHPLLHSLVEGGSVTQTFVHSGQEMFGTLVVLAGAATANTAPSATEVSIDSAKTISHPILGDGHHQVDIPSHENFECVGSL